MSDFQLGLFFFGGGFFGFMMIVRLAIKMNRLYSAIMHLEFLKMRSATVDRNVSPLYGFSKWSNIKINEGDDDELVCKKQEFLREKERSLGVVVRWYIVTVIGGLIGAGVGATIYGMPN
ncbi:hypothetical protein [[Pseudomonas] boreopolis]|uniref:Uncharacterized protein n=1 Tax=Xanthomonas boreopolis TaxID=86183 RepID=A0A919KJP5_9XANT|nr:hypothetical protein GCM10009090_35130 [[Pseudomonas] boreopolis]